MEIKADDDIIFKTNASERMRIDSSGRLLVASTTSRSIWGVNPQLQIEKLDSKLALLPTTINYDRPINEEGDTLIDLIENKDVLLIDDITTSGTSIDAFTHMLLLAKPKTLTTFVYGVTIK